MGENEVGWLDPATEGLPEALWLGLSLGCPGGTIDASVLEEIDGTSDLFLVGITD